MSNANRSSTTSITAPSVSGSSYVLLDSPDDRRRSTEVDSNHSSLQRPPDEVKYEPKTLTMAFVCNKGNEIEEKYAVVPFPDTYEAAVTSAIKTLGAYMSDPRPDNIILRCSTKNRKGEWVWADIFPEGWKMSLEVNRTEVGVFERRNELQSPENRFIHGAVAFTVGSKTAEGTQITWTEPHRRSCARPKSFSHAVDILNKTTQSATAIYWLPDDHHLKDKNRIRFYTFPEDDLCTWKAIPLEAHRDDVIWRTLVPEPGKILGVMAE